MIEYIGKYNKAKITIDNVEENVVNQLYTLLNNPAFSNSNISIMPDVHVGSGAMVGFTMTENDYAVPAVLGSDLGCGVLAINLGNIKPKFEKLDKYINEHIPSGPKINEHSVVSEFDFKDLFKKIDYTENEALRAIGTMGGGNHFICLEQHKKDIWLLVHSGSRHLGLAISDFYKKKAKKHMKDVYHAGAFYQLEYLENEDKQNYFDDVEIALKYAKLNRKTILKQIVEEFYHLQLNKLEIVESVHNYYDKNDKIIRKGSISAHPGERVIIPINRSFGSLFATGKSTEEFNFSAPHGAGRKFNRSDSKNRWSLEEYQRQMKNVFSTTVSKKTMDESPMAYKNPKFILENIKELVDVDFVAKEIYSFKAN